MPWKETSAMQERKQFVLDWFSGSYTKMQLCLAYGISRPTGDKWIARALAEGVDGLAERSRAAHGHPNATTQDVVDMIVSTKLSRPHLGPKKIVDLLRDQQPRMHWPADSTAGEILKRAGLVRKRRVRRRVYPDSKAFAVCEACNDLWSVDFKGDFVLGNRQRCYPLTLTDNHSRYLLQCQALARPNTDQVKPWMQWAFREYGLPRAIRSDNGAPFASLAVGGISELSKWWIKLGIQPQRIKPGKPGQNGRHERMHRSLKEAAVCPPQVTMAAQQHRFDKFKDEFNYERSHEALNRVMPGSLYRVSHRAYPAKLPRIEYPADVIVRHVRSNGEIKWRGHLIYVSSVLANEPIALEQVSECLWEMRFSFHLLGTFDDQRKCILPPKSWHCYE